MSDETTTDVDNNSDSNNRDKNDDSRCRRRVVAHTVILVLRQHRIVTPRGIGTDRLVGRVYSTSLDLLGIDRCIDYIVVVVIVILVALFVVISRFCVG